MNHSFHDCIIHPARSAIGSATAVWAVVTCLTLGACASKEPKPAPAQVTQAALSDLRTAMLVDIAEPTRAQRATALVDELAQEDREARYAAAAQYQRVLALDGNYDATEDEFRGLFADFNSERLQRQNRIVELWTQMAGVTTDTEWHMLKKARVAAVRALTTPG